MARLIIAAAMIVLAACSGPRLDQLKAEAESALAAGRLADADRLVAEGIAATSREPDSVTSWSFRLLGAEVQLARLELPAARPVLDAALPDEPAFASLRARQKVLAARVQVMQGQLKPAEATLDAARRLAPDNRDVRFETEILASQIRYRTGQWDAAEQGLHALVAETEAVGDRLRQAKALNNLGMGYLVRGRYDEALPWFERVLALSDLSTTTIYGQVLNNAGICHARLGQFDQAVASQQKAVERHKGGSQLDYAQALGELGTTFFLMDDVERGMPAWQEALRIATAAELPVEAVLWARNLAEASARLGDWSAAERYNDQASALAPTQSGSRRAFALVTSATIAAGRGRNDEAERLFHDAIEASAEVPSARWMSYDGLARLAAATNRPAEAARYFESALDTVERTRSSLLRADYRISFPSRLIRFYRGYVDLLIQEGQVDRALEVADSSRGRVLAERQGVAAPERRATAASLRQLARQSQSTLLFYWLGPTRSWVWTVTGRRIAATPLPPGPEIEALVTAHQAAIQSALADPLAGAGTAGDRLYDLLVRPIAAEVPPGASLVIVPDGALHRLNFETLPVAGERKHYWIEDVTVQIAPSLAMLQSAGTGRPGHGASLLLIGNPTPRAPEFPALGYAPAEMAAVTSHFQASTVTSFAGERASPAAFKGAETNRFSLIHFTSHAVANIENPLDSAVILSGPDQAYKLYARDVAALPLSAELVTVSACRSAGERAYAGEGLVGFAWAFLRAGSRRVVAGLWDVDDRSTSALMDHVYARIAEGAPPAVALRAAKLTLMKQGFAKPYYWAPFQLFTVVL